ncbi:MAG: carbon-nitrogen hydrolase family protein [Verrucomicrobia bacterium]|nr:carbon-nitrogen hydrolase family protein [Verrucomicrobiota bacterium]
MRLLISCFIGLSLCACLGGSALVAGETVRVASISFVPKKFALSENANQLKRAFSRAASKGAQIALAPEGILEGYVVNEIIAGEVDEEQMREVAVSVDAPLIREFRYLAKELKMCLAFGFAELIDGDVFNSAIFIDHDGEISGKYHKMQFHEGYHPDWWFNRLGKISRTFETPFGRCGFLICNDRWNPDLARIPSLDGAQFLLIPAYGSRSSAQDEAVASRSRENGVPVIEANVGVQLITDGEGTIVALDREMEGITVADIVMAPASLPQVEERDSLELSFMRWREKEMRSRYQATMKRVESDSK